METSTLLSDHDERRARKRLKKQEQIRRKKMRRELMSFEKELAYFSREYKHAWREEYISNCSINRLLGEQLHGNYELLIPRFQELTELSVCLTKGYPRDLLINLLAQHVPENFPSKHIDPDNSAFSFMSLGNREPCCTDIMNSACIRVQPVEEINGTVQKEVLEHLLISSEEGGSEPDIITKEPDIITSEPDIITGKPDFVEEKINPFEQDAVEGLPDIITNESDMVTSEQVSGLDNFVIRAFEEFGLEKEQRSKDQDIVTSEPDITTSEKDSVPSEQCIVTREQDNVTSVRSKQDSVTSEQDIVRSGQDSVTSGHDIVTHEQNIATREQDNVTSQRYNITIRQDIGTSNQGITTNERDSFTSELCIITIEQDTVRGKPYITSELHINSDKGDIT